MACYAAYPAPETIHIMAGMNQIAFASVRPGKSKGHALCGKRFQLGTVPRTAACQCVAGTGVAGNHGSGEEEIDS